METKCNCFYKIIAFLSLLLCVVMLIFSFILPIDESKREEKYIKCENFTNYTYDETYGEYRNDQDGTGSFIKKIPCKAPNYEYFNSNTVICLYCIFRFILNISFILTGDCYFVFLLILIPLYIINLFLIALNTLNSNIYTIICLILDSVINILSLSLYCCSEDGCGDVCKDNFKFNSDCLDAVLEKIKKPKKKELSPKMIELKNENKLLKEGNLKITNEINKINRLKKLETEKKENLKKKETYLINVENKKIEAIIWYVQKKYNKSFNSDIIYQYLINEVKVKCNLEITKEKFKEIFLFYVKEKFTDCLKCPLTTGIFLNPVITPEGQTFDKSLILKHIQKSKENPITRTELKENELVENKLVRDLCEIFRANYDKFSMKDFLEMKKLLINKTTNKFYSDPVVIIFGVKKGETEDGFDGNHIKGKYSNRVILNLIEENKEILSDDFINSL